MYWPFGSPTVLSTPPPPPPSSSTAGGSSSSTSIFEPTKELLLGLAQNRSSSLFATVSRSTISLWSVKVRSTLYSRKRSERRCPDRADLLLPSLPSFFPVRFRSSLQPPVVLAMIQREEDSILEQGETVAAWFAWDSLVIIVLVRSASSFPPYLSSSPSPSLLLFPFADLQILPHRLQPHPLTQSLRFLRNDGI